MNTYLFIFMISMGMSLVLTPFIRRTCESLKLLDEPLDSRRIHKKAIPRLGGIAIFISMGAGLSALLLVNNFATQTLATNRAQVWRLLVPATLVFLFGIFDDLRGANARLKFLAQCSAGVLFCVMGGGISALSFPLLGSLELHPILGYVLTVFWLIAISNAFNLIDGIDGLATGAALFASLVVLAVSLMLGHPLISIVALAMAGSLIGFLRYNFNPASIFLGDSGSLFIGFILAALSVEGTQKASTAVAVAIPVIAFALPVLDTGFAMMRRFIGGQPLFEGDREHIHHKLLERGWSQRRVALVLYGVCALFGLVALLFVGETRMRITGLVLFVIGAAVLFLIGHLRYHEVDEVKAGLRYNLIERRLRVANNIRVRRASRLMSKATSLSEILNAVQELLKIGEFVYANMQVGEGNDRIHNEMILKREEDDLAFNDVEVRAGLIQWSWERGDIEGHDVTNSRQFWALRMPLSTKRSVCWGYLNLYRGFSDGNLLLDINYLCDLFRGEMAQAVERVLSAKESEVDVEELRMSITSAGG